MVLTNIFDLKTVKTIKTVYPPPNGANNSFTMGIPIFKQASSLAKAELILGLSLVITENILKAVKAVTMPRSVLKPCQSVSKMKIY